MLYLSMGEQRTHTHKNRSCQNLYNKPFLMFSHTNQQISKSLVQILTKQKCIKPRQRQGSPYKTQNFGVQGLKKRRHAPPKETHLFLVDFAVISPVAPMVSSINHPIELREPPVALLSPNLVRRNKV